MGSQSFHSFLHAWAWGNFSVAMGNEVVRLGAYEGERLVAVALLIFVRARRGNFISVPHGPVFQDGSVVPERERLVAAFTKEAKRRSASFGARFIRVNPFIQRTPEHAQLFSHLGYRRAPLYTSAENTWILEIDKSEEDLLVGMRKNTRNLVRRAAREGVEVIASTSTDFIEAFCEVYEETVQKHDFVPFSKKYLTEEVRAFNGVGQPRLVSGEGTEARIYLAKWSGKVLSAAIVIFYGNSAYYHHGANSLEHRKVPAAYALQWQAIRDAKAHGKKLYNFWGIAEDEENSNHPWHGLTFFKQGFGGHRVNLTHTHDLPLTSTYWLSYLADKWTAWRRGV